MSVGRGKLGQKTLYLEGQGGSNGVKGTLVPSEYFMQVIPGCQKTEFEAKIRSAGECFHCPVDAVDRAADASITIIICPKVKCHQRTTHNF